MFHLDFVFDLGVGFGLNSDLLDLELSVSLLLFFFLLYVLLLLLFGLHLFRGLNQSFIFSFVHHFLLQLLLLVL
jgi:hypothetical protein